jgi:hypothetical protein
VKIFTKTPYNTQSSSIVFLNNKLWKDGLQLLAVLSFKLGGNIEKQTKEKLNLLLTVK